MRRSFAPAAPLLLASLLAASLGAGGGAQAQPAPAPAALAQARALFKEARRLEDAGQWGDALERLQRVAAVKMTPQVRFHLALCSENIGLWTQAIDGYLLALREAAGAAPDVEAEANQHLHKLLESVPAVTLRALGAAPDDELSLDHRRIPIEADAPPLRVDPGPHAAELRRGGALLARELFTLEPRMTRRIELRAEGAEATEPPREAPATPPREPPPATPPPVAPQAKPIAAPVVPAPTGVSPRTLGWAALGLGTASAMAAGVFLGLRTGALDELDMACPTHTHCDPSVERIVHRGTLDAALVNVFSVLALASVAGGVALLVTAPSPPPASPPPPRISLAPSLGPNGAGLLVGGRF